MTSLGRTAYRDLACYTVDQEPVAVDLRDNTNLWGVPPAAARAIGAAASAVSRYPRIYAAELRRALAEYVRVDSSMVVTGCGSDDVIDAAFRALADPGDRVAMLVPSFATAQTFARMNALIPVEAPLSGDDWSMTVDRLLAADARVIYLCSPNNPTGGLAPRHILERLIEAAPGAVVIDEAYAEYAGGSASDLLARSSRLLVVRTLSKAFGLAGLRVGYGLGHPSLVVEVEKARGPYKVNVVAERAALAVLGEDQEWVRSHVREAVANRERLATALRSLGLRCLPSSANFLCCPTPRAAGIAERLLMRGVGVRVFRALPGVGDAIRITIGPWPMMAQLLDALVGSLGSDAAESPDPVAEDAPCA